MVAVLSSLLRNMGADLLFCPFTAPTILNQGFRRSARFTICNTKPILNSSLQKMMWLTATACLSQPAVGQRPLAAISDYSRDAAITHGSLDPARIRTIYLRMAHRISPIAEHDQGVFNRLGLIPVAILDLPCQFLETQEP